MRNSWIAASEVEKKEGEWDHLPNNMKNIRSETISKNYGKNFYLANH